MRRAVVSFSSGRAYQCVGILQTKREEKENEKEDGYGLACGGVLCSE